MGGMDQVAAWGTWGHGGHVPLRNGDGHWRHDHGGPLDARRYRGTHRSHGVPRPSEPCASGGLSVSRSIGGYDEGGRHLLPNCRPGKNPADLAAADMAEGCVTVTPETLVDDACAVLEENQIRRAVVVDEQGRCCGIAAQADIAESRRELAGAVVEAVSLRTEEPSRAAAPGGGCC